MKVILRIVFLLISVVLYILWLWSRDWRRLLLFELLLRVLNWDFLWFVWNWLYWILVFFHNFYTIIWFHAWHLWLLLSHPRLVVCVTVISLHLGRRKRNFIDRVGLLRELLERSFGVLMRAQDDFTTAWSWHLSWWLFMAQVWWSSLFLVERHALFWLTQSWDTLLLLRVFVQRRFGRERTSCLVVDWSWIVNWTHVHGACEHPWRNNIFICITFWYLQRQVWGRLTVRGGLNIWLLNMRGKLIWSTLLDIWIW